MHLHSILEEKNDWIKILNDKKNKKKILTGDSSPYPPPPNVHASSGNCNISKLSIIPVSATVPDRVRVLRVQQRGLHVAITEIVCF